MSETIRVLIVDDHPIFRDGLATLLETEAGLEVVGTAADGAQAVERSAELGPDVVIMDVQLPVLNGIEATRQLTAAHPQTGVLVITMGEDDATVFAALRAGARGYLLKGAERSEIVRAITTVHAGGVVFGASLAQRIAEVLSTPAPRSTAFPQLTEREREILDLIAAGRSNPQIAATLFLSPKTVRNNVSMIMSKLQATDRATVIVRAREAGLGGSGAG